MSGDLDDEANQVRAAPRAHEHGRQWLPQEQDREQQAQRERQDREQQTQRRRQERDQQRQREAPATTRGTMYELYVLGEVMEGPMHGYLLPKIITYIIGPYRQMSWGALYPLIHRLEDEGLIELCERPDEGGGRRKAYATTAAGRSRFAELMADPGEYDADYRDLFTIKVSKFGYVEPLVRLDILRHYRGYVETLRAHMESHLADVAKNPYISPTERPGVLRALNHRLQLIRADMQWVEQEIAQTEDTITARPET
jgi:DNA-binding PadR family transcriptional regulator